MVCSTPISRGEFSLFLVRLPKTIVSVLSLCSLSIVSSVVMNTLTFRTIMAFLIYALSSARACLLVGILNRQSKPLRDNLLGSSSWCWHRFGTLAVGAVGYPLWTRSLKGLDSLQREFRDVWPFGTSLSFLE